MPLSSLSFLAGIVLVQQLPWLPDGASLMMGLLLAGFLVKRHHLRCLFFVLGALWAVVFADARLSERLPEALEGADILLTGYITGLPEAKEKGIRFNFVISPSQESLPDKIRLTWHSPEHSLKAGQFWSMTVRLKRPHGTLNPGGFDYERWLLSEGIGATGYVRSFPKPELLKIKSPWYRIDVWRQVISDSLSGLLTGYPSLSLIKALTIGDGRDISQQQWQLFRETGTTHLVVISGSHIGLVSGFIYYVVLKILARTGLLRWPPPKVAALAAMSIAILYSALAGFSVPTQRAVIMLAMVMTALILQRHIRPLHTLAVALIAVLAVDPLAVWSPGFWLSFLAVGLIVSAVSGRLGKIGVLVGSVKLQWHATLGLAPLLLLFFQQASLIAPLANLIAVPVISLAVVPLSLLAVSLMFILPKMAAGIFYLIDQTLEGLTGLLTLMTELPSAAIYYPQPSFWALFFAVPGILLLLAPAGTPFRWLSLAMFLPMIFIESSRPQPGEIRLTLLDVGQGLAVAVQTTNHWLIYDAGARFSEESDMGQSVVLPYLRFRGVSKIDRLIVSHGDNDHIGGAASLLKGALIEAVMTSVPEQLQAHAPTQCAAGQSWQWDRVVFTILSPEQSQPGTDNNNSCVLKIESQQGAVLLPGDIEAEVESRLVNTYGEALQADVLIAPHHGSKTSSTAEFLRAVQPSYVLIPAGYRNQFGHPHKDVLARYRQFKSRWLISANSGAIEITLKNHSLQVTALREAEKRYWRTN
ncbi:MAG: DNA internalization-related competence protein ComEC/Rec2 [Methylosarcina sp.]